MRRSFTGLVAPAVLSAAVTLACFAVANADDESPIPDAPAPASAEPTANAPETPAEAPSTEAAAAPERQGHKPEDGLDLENGMRANKLVRALMAERPADDLIICVAGCFDSRSRVVYAQPMEIRQQAITKAAPDGEASMQPTAAEPAKSAPPSATTDAPGPGANAEGAKLPQMVPTAAGSDALRGAMTETGDTPADAETAPAAHDETEPAATVPDAPLPGQ